LNDQAIIKALRKDDADNAIVFIHGFGGRPESTWGSFPDFLAQESALDGWDLYSLGYTTSLAPDFRGIWTGSPSIPTIAKYLQTRVSVGELEGYKALTFIAHSMGGLVVQRALLDHDDLRGRTAHVFLFGTPSAGLKKAGWIRWFKRQTEDMDAGGAFIKGLREDWEAHWPKDPPPRFWTVAGDTDEFVPASSSLDPFPDHQRLVVPGNHLEIVKPEAADNLGVQAVVNAITGEAAPGGPWNAARVALQMLDFSEVVDTLDAHAAELDDKHLIQLAIALEGLGRSGEAMRVLNDAGERGTDARGVLAGRLKRRWIAEGRESDFGRALQLYKTAYAEANALEDHPQAFYHGINVCFLLAARGGDRQAVETMAEKVLAHCAEAQKDFWCLGTEGEAKLYLGDIEGALEAFKEAIAVQPPPRPWQVKSMHSQASQALAILNRHKHLQKIDKVFREHPG